MGDQDQPLRMWSYWRDKKGIAEALEDYYSQLLASSGELQHALFLIKNGERLINSVMEESD